MNLWTSERIFVLTAAVVATASLVAFGGRETSVGPVALPEQVSGTVDEPHWINSGAKEHPETWNAPMALARGREWVYEVFTPPEILYDSESRRFRVAGDSRVEDSSRTSDSADFGFELVAIEAIEFPLQLVGYVGEPGAYRGIFTNVTTTETFLGAAGRRVPELGLVIETFGVTRKAVAIAESMSTLEWVAEATVRHEFNGEETVLNDRAQALSGLPRVRLRRTQRDGADWVAGEGDGQRIRDILYRIEKIQLAPASVTISKETAGATAPERRTLTPPVSASGLMQ
jgi:hypothetical protein